MSELVTLPVIYFLLLAVVTISAALVSRTEGKSSILVTGAVAWIMLTIWIPALSSGPGNPLTFSAWGILGLFLGFALTLALAPLYFFGSEGSLSKKLLWSVAGAAVTAPVVLFLMVMVGDPIPDHYPCNLPTLRSDLHFEPLVEVSTASFFSDECPIPIDKKFRLQRDWGMVQFEWHTSNLWMKATTAAGSDLLLTGEGIRQDNGAFLGEAYTATKHFDGQRFVDANVKSDFVVKISGSNGDLKDTLNLTYDTIKCTCAVYDSL